MVPWTEGRLNSHPLLLSRWTETQSPMYAIIENGSHQFKVREGELITIDRQPGKAAGDEVVFDKVLLIAGHDGDPRIGTPLVEGARVVAEVVEEYRGRKIVIRKFKRRKGYRRKRGHRQYYTDVRITSVLAGA